jgi:hypothetical protein
MIRSPSSGAWQESSTGLVSGFSVRAINMVHSCSFFDFNEQQHTKPAKGVEASAGRR